MSYRYGTNPAPYPLPLGTLWRYDAGSTALCELVSLHEAANGYHARQCMGGLFFVGHHNIKPASVEDNKKWYECAKWRRPTTATVTDLTRVTALMQDAIADLIEAALRAEAETLLYDNSNIKLICWCMGTAQVVVTEIENWDGEDVEVEGRYPDHGDRKTPAYLADFFAIAELDDRLYNVITGRPRRYERKPDGTIEQITEW